MKPDSSQLRDFAMRYTAAWCSRDANSVAAFYSPGGSLSVNGGAPAIRAECDQRSCSGLHSRLPRSNSGDG